MSHCRHRAALLIALLLLLVSSIMPGAAQAVTAAESSAAQSATVAVEQPTATVATDGTLKVTVTVTTTIPADYLEVRLRLKSESGTLIYQKTEVRHSTPSGTNTIAYEYDLAPRDLSPGRYPIEVRVLATGSEPTYATSHVLLRDAQADPLPVAVVLRYLQEPSVGLDGTFSIDPSSQTAACDTLHSLTEFIVERHIPVSLIIAPVTLEEYARAAAGYETTSGVTVAATESVPQRYAALLETLASATTTGTLDLLDIPYALPDLGEDSSGMTIDDLALQWSQTDAVLTSALRSNTASSTAYLGETISLEALATLAGRNDSALLVPSCAVESGETTVATGCYLLEDSDIQVLIADETLPESALAGANTFYEALFDYRDSGGVILMIDVGQDSLYSTRDIRWILDLVTDAPWLELTNLPAISTGDDLPAVSIAPTSSSAAPSEYWSTVSMARTAVFAYLSAVGSADSDANAAVRAVLVSESALFAGKNGSWTGAATGLKTARDAYDYVMSQFDLVHLNIMDVTLSGRKGDVPVAIVNDTGKELTLTLSAESAEMSISDASVAITALPEENFLTIPVDMGNDLSGDLRVSLIANGLTITDTVVHVKASYIDRLATVGMVILVLVGLLFYVHRRVRSAEASPPAPSNNQTDGNTLVCNTTSTEDDAEIQS